jgi:hypothetical protein
VFDANFISSASNKQIMFSVHALRSHVEQNVVNYKDRSIPLEDITSTFRTLPYHFDTESFVKQPS